MSDDLRCDLAKKRSGKESAERLKNDPPTNDYSPTEENMDITVNTKKLVAKEKTTFFLPEGTKAVTEERVARTLKNYADEIKSVEVHFEDETSDSGKFDGRCRIHVYPKKGKMISIDAHGENFNELLSNAVNKIQHAVSHERDRRRDR